MVSTHRNKSENIVSLTSSQHFEQVNMKSKQSNSRKGFLPYSQQQSASSSNWGDKVDIAIAVDMPTSAPTAQNNVSSPCVQTGGSNMSMPCQDNVSSSHVQTGGSNVSMPHGQGMGTSTMRPNIVSTAIPYGDNQPVDPNLWDWFFFPHFYIWG